MKVFSEITKYYTLRYKNNLTYLADLTEHFINMYPEIETLEHYSVMITVDFWKYPKHAINEMERYLFEKNRNARVPFYKFSLRLDDYYNGRTFSWKVCTQRFDLERIANIYSIELYKFFERENFSMPVKIESKSFFHFNDCGQIIC